MRNRTLFALLIVILAAAGLASCGGSSQPSLTLEPTPAFAGSDDLPVLPEARDFNPSKITAAVSTMRDGNQTFDYSPNVAIAGTQAQFGPGADEVAWAVYEFPGSTADDIESIEYFVSNRTPDGLVWTAISNYAADTWEYFGHRNADHSVFNPTGGNGDYASESGHTYVMVLGWDGVVFDLDRVTITYGNRYPVTGQVVDMGGAGVAMATVTTSLGGGAVMTDAAGNFTLPAIPDGTWHIMATKPGWIFFDNPTEFTVSGGPLSGIQLKGMVNDSHFDPIEDQEPNDNWWEAPNMDPATPIVEYISASDDPDDYFRFAFTTPGQYYIRFVGDPSVLFPSIALLNKEGHELEYSSWIYGGVAYMGFTVATTRVVYFHVSCSGGGGEYQLTTSTGDLNALHGSITGGGTLSYVKVKLEAGGDTTYMYTSGGQYGSNYMQPIITTVTPDPLSEDIYTYVPAFNTYNLSLGDESSADFTGTPGAITDHYEPNDSDSTAYDFGALPLASHDTVTVGGSGSDTADWYKFTPTAGKDFIVHINYLDKPTVEYSAFTSTLYDSAISNSQYAYPTDTGMEVRSNGASDGNAYYLVIYCWDDRYFPYELTIEEFDGYTIEVGGLLGGHGVVGAMVDVYNLGLGWKQTFETQSSGLTEIPFRFMNGEIAHVEFFRYGLSADRYTKEITINGDNEKVWFTSYEDESADRYEPNDSYGKLVDYPMDSDATISGYSDNHDKYIFTTTSTDMVHVTFDSAEDEVSYNADLRVHSSGDWVSNYSWTGDADFLMPTNGIEQYRLEIATWEGETTYHITIDEAPGYMLSGTVLDGASSPVMNSYVYSPDLDMSAYAGSGNYELGPFPPGTYDIFVYCPNWESTPASPWAANFTNSDLTRNFVLSVNYTDVGEPDDTWAQASIAPTGTPMTANLCSGVDGEDWYKFTAGPGFINVNATYPDYIGQVYLYLYDTDGTTLLEDSTVYGAVYQRIDYLLPAAGTYYVKIYCWIGGCEYTFTANY